MGYSRVYAEYMVPPFTATDLQLDFYNAINWLRYAHPEAQGDTFICPAPLPDEAALPVFSYWQTGNTEKLARFDGYAFEKPSAYALGNRLPDLQKIVQVTLGVQTDDAVHKIYESGGDLMRMHAEAVLLDGKHNRPREEYGRQILSFVDPFNYLINVAANRPDEYLTPASGDPIQITINVPFEDNRDFNQQTIHRMQSFFEAIGFGFKYARSGIPEMYVSTDPNFGKNQPVITYKMVDDRSIANQYQVNGELHGSEYYAGLGLRAMYDMVEICLIVPDNEAVYRSYDEAMVRTQGLFAKHAHVGWREWPKDSGRWEYRFTDPFSVAIRVTSPSALIEEVSQNFLALSGQVR